MRGWLDAQYTTYTLVNISCDIDLHTEANSAERLYSVCPNSHSPGSLTMTQYNM